VISAQVLQPPYSVLPGEMFFFCLSRKKGKLDGRKEGRKKGGEEGRTELREGRCPFPHQHTFLFLEKNKTEWVLFAIEDAVAQAETAGLDAIPLRENEATANGSSRSTNTRGSTWMKDMYDADVLKGKTMLDLVVPGSHHIGEGPLYGDQFYGSNHVALNTAIQAIDALAPLGIKASEVVEDWAICQNLTPYEQLAAGIRHMDLRVAFDDNTYPGPPASGLQIWRSEHSIMGLPFQETLDSIAAFANEHPEEVLTMQMQALSNWQTESQQLELIAMVENAFGSKLLPAAAGLPEMEAMMESGQTIIAIFPSSWVSLRPEWMWSSSMISSTWPNADNVPAMTDFNSRVAESYSANSEQYEGRIYVVQWLMTASADAVVAGLLNPFAPKSLDDFARSANPELDSWVDGLIEKNQKPGTTLWADFVEYGDLLGATLKLNNFE
jgi:hypothetical protein